MDLRRLTQNTGCRLLRGDALTEITSVCCDSRCAGPGALFVCLPGRHADGHDFAAQAVAAGAAAVLCTHDVPGLHAGCAVLLAGDPRRAMAALAARLYGEPARAMTMIGVTGTKGKTTTSYMVKSICEQAGFKCGLVGTTGNMIGEKHIPSSKTTPDPIDLMRDLNEMVQAGVQVETQNEMQAGMPDSKTFICRFRFEKPVYVDEKLQVEARTERGKQIYECKREDREIVWNMRIL